MGRLHLWAGRWATRPGEVVLNRDPDWTADDLGVGSAAVLTPMPAVVASLGVRNTVVLNTLTAAVTRACSSPSV